MTMVLLRGYGIKSDYSHIYTKIQVGTVALGELAQRSPWKGNICFNFIATVLSMIEQRLPRGSPDYSSCQVRYDTISKKVYLEDAKEEETKFLPDEYIRHFNLPERL